MEECKDQIKNDKYFMAELGKREIERLIQKVNVTEFYDRYMASIVKKEMKILDAGCGPGVIPYEIASRSGCEVVGLDNDPPKIQYGNSINDLKNLSFVCSDVRSIPFPDETFDLVTARFLLQYLPDPENAVKEMHRVCKKNGFIWLQDLDGQFLWHFPEDDKLQKKIEGLFKRLKKATGFDTYIGRKLYYFLYSVNCGDIRTQVDSYHLYPGIINEKDYGLWRDKLDIARRNLNKRVLSQKKGKQIRDHILSYFKRADTISYSVVFSVLGRK